MPVLSKMRRSTAGVAALGACGFAGSVFLAPTNPLNMMRNTAGMSSRANSMVQQGAAPTDSMLSHTLVGGAVGSLAVLSHLATSRGACAQTSTVSRHAFDASSQLGAMAPLGFFDPLGFSNGDESNFRNLRAAEIKHGRVAMMAAVGAVAQHYLKFPGFENVPAGLSAVTTQPGTYGFAALFLVAGALELGVWTESPNKEPGNFGDPLGLNQYTEDVRGKEINNGRMAMFAVFGIISAELLTGKDGIEQLGLSATGGVKSSQSRGFTFIGRSSRACAQTSTVSRHAFDASGQLGAMAPLGFFDPLGFSNGDESNFRNLRAAEIKHGRVAMMAAVGAVAQHYLKFPGFENVPAGLSAVTTQPGTYGFAALFLVAGALELGVWTESPNKEPGNFGDPLGLNQYTEDVRGKEINNGRMAMFAVFGIISAELFTGKDAIEQLAS